MSVTLAALLSFTAAADIAVENVDVQEPTLPGEWDLVAIYDAIFGVSSGYASGDALYEAVGVDPDDYNGPTVSHFFGDRALSMEARYATYGYDFGYYDPVLNDPVANQNVLLSLSGPYVDPGSGGPSALLNPAVEPYGFYLDVAETDTEYYSEYDRNCDQWVHMLLLAAPTSYDPTGQTYLLAWEDRCSDDPQADWDYNDLVVLVSVIPEPSSIVLMGLGIASLAVRRLRRFVA